MRLSYDLDLQRTRAVLLQSTVDPGLDNSCVVVIRVRFVLVMQRLHFHVDAYGALKRL